MKGRARRILLFFFLVMYSAIPFFLEKHAMFLFQLVHMLFVRGMLISFFHQSITGIVGVI